MSVPLLLWITFVCLFGVLLLGRAYTERGMLAVEAAALEAESAKQMQDEEVRELARRSKLVALTLDGILRISHTERFYWSAAATMFRHIRGEYVQDAGTLAFSNMRVVFDSPRGIKQFFMDEIEKVDSIDQQFRMYLKHRPLVTIATAQADVCIYFEKIHEEYLATLHLRGWNRYYADR